MGRYIHVVFVYVNKFFLKCQNKFAAYKNHGFL